MKQVLGLAVLGVLCLAFVYGLDFGVNPWAHGSSTLTGGWVGMLADKRALFVELHRTLTPSGDYEDEEARISGKIEVCGAGRDERYELAGDPSSWSGRTFRLARMNIVAPAVRRGLFFHHAEGEWRGDEVALTVQPVLYAENGGTYISGQQPFPVKLARGDRARFEQACRASIQ